ncbi:hypothetical protein PAMP_000342 [Pampus punctatissimus]
MTNILQLASEAGKRTLPTLSKLSEDDIDSIWADVSAYIGRQGVHLAGLGTFTFSQQKLDIGNKFIVIQRPIFLLAGKLAQSLGLKQGRPLAAATNLPVVQLNLTAVSQETPFSREVVEGCVRETLLLLVRALASEQTVFLPLQGIGVLSFKNNKRPGSSASLMSGGQSRMQRPQTANHITLPTVCSPQLDNKADDKEGWCLSPAPDQRNAQEVPQQRESKSYQIVQPAKMKAVSLSEDLNPKPPIESTDKPTIVSPIEVTPTHEEPHVNVNCSGHSRAGQELCYLCMQRAQRNVPVYLRKQRETEEKAQEKLLLFKEQQRDKEFMEKEQAKLHEHREHTKRVAAFNLQISEKKEKAYCPQYPKDEAALLHERASEPDREPAATRSTRPSKLSPHGASRPGPAGPRLGDKKDKKGTDLEECQPDNAGFSCCETPVSNAESRERAQKLFQVNFSVATQKKQEVLHNRKVQLEKEREMLKHNRMQLILDRINRFEKKRDISKSLENEWCWSVKLKHQREEEERHFLRSAGQLLVDKLAQYRRCCQCKRRTSNSGETNIWKDSHYLSGSQFMI